VCEQGTEIIQTTYTLNGNSGYMLEGDFEGIYPITRNVKGTFWLNGSWMQASGTGSLTSNVLASTLQFAANIQSGNVDIPNSQIQRSWYGLGLGLEMSF
jgi:hypothetical protein